MSNRDGKHAVGSLKLPFGASAASFPASTSTDRTIPSVCVEEVKRRPVLGKRRPSKLSANLRALKAARCALLDKDVHFLRILRFFECSRCGLESG